MNDIRYVTARQLRKEQKQIEKKVPGIAAAWNDPDWNHGDSCWQGHPDVEWHPLADKFDQNQWLLGVDRPKIEDEEEQ